ncbi:MAG: NAD(P)H-dependent oxidoreductase [Gammaproteobacteria bacterium]|jgi:FMN-dependent NADH-azoreductase|nr:NAD(P)H-dependent oxidoreductase [Gammaproteobacteria bacterium]
MHTPSNPTVLRVDASARYEGSTTRQLTDALIDALRERHGRLPVITRDLALSPPPLLDADWIAANTTEPQTRTAAQRAALAYSDQLIAELTAADVVILGVPVYNFGVPAALKAWIDLVARARVTFRYSENGPQGLLKGKRAYVVLASGGVAAGGPTDFASGYLRQVLGFLGITDVEVIAADQAMLRSDAVSRARRRIGELLPATAA